MPNGISVPASPIQIDQGWQALSLENMGKTDVYIGDSGVNAGNGRLLAPRAVLQWADTSCWAVCPTGDGILNVYSDTGNYYMPAVADLPAVWNAPVYLSRNSFSWVRVGDLSTDANGNLVKSDAQIYMHGDSSSITIERNYPTAVKSVVTPANVHLTNGTYESNLSVNGINLGLDGFYSGFTTSGSRILFSTADNSWRLSFVLADSNLQQQVTVNLKGNSGSNQPLANGTDWAVNGINIIPTYYGADISTDTGGNAVSLNGVDPTLKQTTSTSVGTADPAFNEYNGSLMLLTAGHSWHMHGTFQVVTQSTASAGVGVRVVVPVSSFFASIPNGPYGSFTSSDGTVNGVVTVSPNGVYLGYRSGNPVAGKYITFQANGLI